MDRKQFIRRGLAAAGLGFIAPSVFARPQDNGIFTAEEIREFVGAAHRDFDLTKKIIDEKPLVLNCTNQGKRGDFETAVGGASHVGRRDIADLLVERGARLDIFNLTFLGHTELVKSLIEASPHYLRAPGPHGLTLLHHAVVGGHGEFAGWLREQGLEEERFPGIFG